MPTVDCVRSGIDRSEDDFGLPYLLAGVDHLRVLVAQPRLQIAQQHLQFEIFRFVRCRAATLAKPAVCCVGTCSGRSVSDFRRLTIDASDEASAASAVNDAVFELRQLILHRFC